ncbi:MAG: hypothetical protein WD273_15140 [Trueperaceae bacterium]
MKPPKFAALRPTFGVGIIIGAILIFGTQATGSEPAFALVLGGGAGIALGLTRRAGPESLAKKSAALDEQEVEHEKEQEEGR